MPDLNRSVVRRCALVASTAALAFGAASVPSGAPAAVRAAGAPDPNKFGHVIDNPYLPFFPGVTMIYRSSDEGEHGREVVHVTRRTKLVQGVTVRVVRDKAFVKGKLVEDTRDWYAQDNAGNVWYFGENTKTVKNGKVVSREGSWRAGRDGAQAGIVMEAHPKVGDRYKQEDATGVAEDRGQVLGLDAAKTVPYGEFGHLLKTKDFSPLEPDVVEHKFFARGIGSVLEKEVRGGSERLVLVNITYR
jgi:hypothetical protein